MSATSNQPTATAGQPRISRRYLTYLIVFMGLVAIMDQYLSTIKTTAIPYILEEYGITPSRFSWLEAAYLVSSFFIFLLNGLTDVIGRKGSILVLVLLMGLSALGILVLSPTLHLFMVFYALAIFTTVSNMWTIPISEESDADSRARNVALVYVIGLIPLQALMPPLLLNVLGLHWKWMYGVMFVFMLPLLVMWFRMRETKRYDAVSAERSAGKRKRHILGLGVIDRHDLRYIFISASIWLCWLVYSVLYFWAGYYFMDVKGYTLGQWSMVLLGTLLMAMAGGVAGGWLMDRLGRQRSLVWGCGALALVLVGVGFGQGALLIAATVVTGFLTSFCYTWIIVFVPEIFPTERRGTCMGWTTTLARISYVAGPALAAVLLKAFPTMEWFWVVAAVVVLLPIAIIRIYNPYETRVRDLEDIEVARRV